ncbi:hypothetical protein EPUS_08560 [Endocarpon pusillum Z07020]|uniref:Uncharacterized protein n=1 Tax=Endocarpon pusillum (strain Z07020 / HMAS-L-300199) TaxID=1263415 RepID=U1G8J0_ENDPU|nr:uncharacterized protein EPUS_08560 [Endocarpon pusillum Z07020]ERF73762.1 hypothetical protein EPUS_08560 [Endocarpon pusillum Z07020]
MGEARLSPLSSIRTEGAVKIRCRKQLFFRAACDWQDGITHDNFVRIIQDLRSRSGVLKFSREC